MAIILVTSSDLHAHRRKCGLSPTLAKDISFIPRWSI